MGTTLTAALVGDGELAIAHVGDSRAYRLRDGRARAADPTTTRWWTSSSAPGSSTPEEAEHHPQRSIITRALGPEPDVEVDTYTYPRARATCTCSARTA